MKRANVSVPVLFVVFIVAVVFAYFFLFGGQKGISLNCENAEIEGIMNVPPPLMAITQPFTCEVDVSVTTVAENTHVCSGNFKIFSGPRDVFPCNQLKNYPDKQILIKATFYDENGNDIGSDQKTLTYET